MNDCLKSTSITENVLEEKDHSILFLYKLELLKTYICITLKEEKIIISNFLILFCVFTSQQFS